MLWNIPPRVRGEDGRAPLSWGWFKETATKRKVKRFHEQPVEKYRFEAVAAFWVARVVPIWA